MAHGQELTSESYVTMLDPLKESSFKLTALYEEEAGVDNDQDTVLSDTVLVEEAEATAWCSFAILPRWERCCRKGREPEIANQFQEAGR